MSVQRDNAETSQPGALDPAMFLYERYRDPQARSRTRQVYYRAKPLLPRPLQLSLRRAFVPIQRRQRFPAWPIEPILVQHDHERLLTLLRESAAERVPLVSWWPDHKRFCFVLTHDVEGPAGVQNIEFVRELEREYGFVSAWNFVAEDYSIPAGLFAQLRGEGCEVGLHGIKHDNSLFRDRQGFEAALPKIRDYLERWEAVGFRSPATHRNADWMHELPCLYDSSFPDTDPFEPVPGGCCSIMPFFFGGVVELPITLAQDHTLFEILRERSIDRWVQKANWIIENHGLINVIIHPDYMLSSTRFDRYRELLELLSRRSDGWHDLPRNVARWWTERVQLACREDAGAVGLAGATDFAASVSYAREQGGRIVFDV
ncbi:MAG: hypothetical protein ACR2QA_15620 [Solirubrobacteraceae bacterium]